MYLILLSTLKNLIIKQRINKIYKKFTLEYISFLLIHVIVVLIELNFRLIVKEHGRCNVYGNSKQGQASNQFR
jgi:hypothetical protein